MTTSTRVFVLVTVMILTGCLQEVYWDTPGDESHCPEPQLDDHPTTCSFYLQHTDDIPNLLCRVPNGFHDPILSLPGPPPPPVLTDKHSIWVTAKQRTNSRGRDCGQNFGAIVDQQYRPGWTRDMPDCVWVACTEFADLSQEPPR